jgi:hypothetical protein
LCTAADDDDSDDDEPAPPPAKKAATANGKAANGAAVAKKAVPPPVDDDVSAFDAVHDRDCIVHTQCSCAASDPAPATWNAMHIARQGRMLWLQGVCLLGQLHGDVWCVWVLGRRE